MGGFCCFSGVELRVTEGLLLPLDDTARSSWAWFVVEWLFRLPDDEDDVFSPPRS